MNHPTTVAGVALRLGNLLYDVLTHWRRRSAHNEAVDRQWVDSANGLLAALLEHQGLVYRAGEYGPLNIATLRHQLFADNMAVFPVALFESVPQHVQRHPLEAPAFVEGDGNYFAAGALKPAAY